jgi:tetraacyldisaccharide 4'-kinase
LEVKNLAHHAYRQSFRHSMTPSPPTLFAIGRPFSPVYSLLMSVRQNLYRRNILTVHRLAVPVISVGNLTLGGTGKTPTVAWIARFLHAAGHRPAIISRGYGGTAKGAVNLVSDGSQVLLTADQAGDEPAMLARQLPGIAVLTGKIRLHPCRHAIERLGSTILILDDGFQHLAIARDIDLVLFNATTLAGNSRVFPGGELREPVSALHRCTAFLLTGVDDGNVGRAERFAALLNSRFPDKPVFYSAIAGELPAPPNPESTADSLPPFFAFCAIAHPDRFFNSLYGMKLHVTGKAWFRDHHRYNQNDVDVICRRAKASGARALITTEKDLVKLEPLQVALPLLTLKTRFETDDCFPDYLSRTLGITPSREARRLGCIPETAAGGDFEPQFFAVAFHGVSDCIRLPFVVDQTEAALVKASDIAANRSSVILIETG